MENENIEVSKTTFDKFIMDYNKYVRELTIDITEISTPPTQSFNDFTLGKWPDSVVALVSLGEDMYGYFKTKEENDKHCVNSYYIKKKFLDKQIMKKDYKTYYECILRDLTADDKAIRKLAEKVLPMYEVYGSETKVEPTLVELTEKLTLKIERLLEETC